MQMKRLAPCLSCCGYLLYTVVVLLLMLWLQFPAAAVKAKAEAELNRLLPALSWKIGAIDLTLPADIRFSQIKISGKGEKEALLTAESLSLRPDLLTWRQTGRWSVLYQLRLLDGSINGRMGLSEDRRALQYSGKITGIRLDSPGLKKVLREYGRTLSGTLSGTFAGKQNGKDGFFAEIEGRFQVAKGAVSLQAPVLGMEQLAFEHLSSTAQVRSGTMQLKDGKLESRLLAADFSGELRLTVPAVSSSIRLKGSLAPRPEFLAAAGGPALASLLKNQLRDGKLPFTVTGSLSEPGIVFSGLPAVFSRQQIENRGQQP